jgi:hypothetical protein
MAHIILTEEQARIVAQAQQGVEVRDPQGRPVAFLHPLTAEEAIVVAEARRRLQTPEPGIPSARVMDMMAQLQALHDRGEATPEAIKVVVQGVVPGGGR